jgi:anti-sigma factor RsiW
MSQNFKYSSNRRQTKMNWATDNNKESDIDLEEIHSDRFELLSAYLDSEVSPTERQQIESWLASDPQARQLHQRLLKLRQGWQQAATPMATISADALADKVFERVDRRKNKRKVLFWAGGAIAALFAGVAIISDPVRTPIPQLANQLEMEATPEDLLAAVSVDEPAVIIPKAADVYLPKEVKLKVDSVKDN